uniref:IC97/Casc1 N-terminal domain-containing protein n=1 Tax=Chromera velia CCMP2878 TaxID=1169474 RepID=A0A0G4ICS5_9ALVE|eukprot:Cvel_13118.t1-p1 / transcript=Cvel_13118.t1 / gene=Cvel_13118 / organism=Chromera_velia_CCMP2878 / gene_product=hypothetical protein / transcript_product=hypothetical protein / location=Cvel_scaffold884:23345-31117(+) / protein_length=844 / sequence_SO=supercontig / SO=protein_coding / is_pseudo=false
MAPKKKSKKQLAEELARQEEERLKKEEEERIQREIEEKERAERERLQKELEAELAAQEAAWLAEEAPGTAEFRRKRETALDEAKSKKREKDIWHQFLECRSHPNPEKENQVQTFIFTLKEERKDKVEDSLNTCSEAGGYLETIRDIELQHIDRSCAVLLSTLDDERAEWESQGREKKMQQDVQKMWVSNDKIFSVGVWAFLQSKGFKTKIVDWNEIGITAEVPKNVSMHTMNHAFSLRVLMTTFDAATFLSPSTAWLPVGGVLRAQLALVPPFAKKVNGWTMRAVQPGGLSLNLVPFPNPDAKDVVGTTQYFKFTYKIPDWCVVVGSKVNVMCFDPEAQRDDLQMGTDAQSIPPPLPSSPSAARMEPSREGGAAAQGEEGEAKEKGEEKEKETQQEPIPVPQHKPGAWILDPIQNIVVEEKDKSKRVQFETSRLGLFAIVQERHFEFPYQWWQFKAKSEDSCELLLKTQRFLLHFFICDRGVCLLAPDCLELDRLLGSRVKKSEKEKEKERGEKGEKGDTQVQTAGGSLGQGSRRTAGTREDREKEKDWRTTGVIGDRQRVFLSPASLLLGLRQSGINVMPEALDMEMLTEDIVTELEQETAFEGEWDGAGGENRAGVEGGSEGMQADGEGAAGEGVGEVGSEGEKRRPSDAGTQTKDSDASRPSGDKGAKGGKAGGKVGGEGPGQRNRRPSVPINSELSKLYAAAKTREVESAAALDLASIAGCFDIASAKHNRFLPAGEGLVRVCENNYYEDFDCNNPDTEGDFKPVCFWANKCSFVDVKEKQGRLQVKSAEECRTHASLHLCLPDKKYSSRVINKVESVHSVVFGEKFRQMFSLLRPLSFG